MNVNFNGYGENGYRGNFFCPRRVAENFRKEQIAEVERLFLHKKTPFLKWSSKKNGRAAEK